MSAFVLDASVAVDLLLAHAWPRLDAVLTSGAFVATAHLDTEVLSALARMHRRGEITQTQVGLAIDDLADLAVERIVPRRSVIRRAWSLRHNVTMSDALCLALAEDLGTVVVTVDGRLRRAAPELTVGPDEISVN